MKRSVLKKLLAVVLVFAMLAPIVGNLGTNVGLVQAEETESVGYVVVPSSAVTITEPTDEGQPKVMSVKSDDATYGQYADYIFAGWYTDAEAQTAAASGTTGDYARFVPADVLSTKVQVTNGIVTDTTNENYKDKYIMRFVSSVDSIDYKYAGFELSYTDKTTNEVIRKTSKTYKAFKRIDSTTGATDNNVDTYEFSPKVVDTKSEYFITGKWPVAEEDKAVNYTVKAYWMTKDGTKVYGRERCVSVEDGIGETGLNLTLDKDLTIGGNYTAFYNNRAGSTVPISTEDIEVLTTGKGYSNVRIKNASRDTKSVTTITITDGNDTTATGLYRNLYTKYTGTGTADTTWYDMYNATDDEFIIATSADLYGLATLTKEKGYDFGGDKIYVVSDIATNPEKLELLENENYLKWYTYDEEKQKVYQTAPSYSWTPIGIDSAGKSLYFKGTFDGQGHTIKGIYINGGNCVGLFRCVDTDGTVKNVKLQNSYIKTNGYDVGSIVGLMKGTLASVYSDAIIECGDTRSGGLIGSSRGTHTMSNCWYAGKITNTSSNKTQTGGLVGTIMKDVTLTMTSCLNTGTVDVSAFVSGQPFAGGLVGKIGPDSAATLVLKDSLSTGEIKHAASVTNGYAASVCVDGKGKLDLSNTYVVTSASSNKQIYLETGATYNATPTNVTDIKGTAAQTNMGNLGWGTTWTTVAHGIPVLSVFEKEVFDTSWYDEDKTVYVMKDKGDLYGLASLSAEIDFAGKTVKLENDILVNTGNAEEWESGADVPDYLWTPIGVEGTAAGRSRFAGNFDGQGHTISGIYHTTSNLYSGLFSSPTSDAVVQNFKLTNSYFKSTKAHFGSIAGYGECTFNNVYSNAIVTASGGNCGGFVGTYGGSKSMNNCWFAGKVNNTGTSARFVGGFVGDLPSNTTITLNNCLNTGTISSAYTGGTNPQLGGLIGRVVGTVYIKHCLNVGLVQQKVDDYYGPIIGHAAGTEELTDTYATTESARLHNKGKLDTSVTTQQYKTVAETNVLGAKASTNVSGLGFYSEENPDGAWITVDYRTPVLKVFKNESDGRIDVSWYDENATEYTLYDEQDLYGFAMISKTQNFDGKTVKLGADIVLNEGTASADWATKSNYRQWSPIGYVSNTFSDNKLFMGTFDGQGHEISGLYINTGRFIGLFSTVGESGIVENVKLTNSYLTSTMNDFGSIAGYSTGGTFYNIYSNATVAGKGARIGGLIGQSNNDSLENCWFAGSVTNVSTNGQGTGGLIGQMQSGTLRMRNCLNSGTVDASSYNSVANNVVRPCVGGIIGYIYDVNSIVIMNACLNVGEIKWIQTEELTADNGYGPLVGYNRADGTAVSMSACYATNAYDSIGKNHMSATYEVVTEEDVKANAETTMPLLDWKVWKAVEGAFPEIQFDYTTSAGSWAFTATEGDIMTLTSLYSGRSLYQGEMHDHAQTYGRGPDLLPGDDGTVSLATWKEQMQTLGLDFAASLDHNQIDHIDLEDWDESKFVYGSEASATIKDDTGTTIIGELHFDMIFKTKEQFQSIIDKYSSKFNFDYSTDTIFYYTGLVFTKTEFKTFIKDIMQVGGVCNLPHPLQNDSYNATGLEDYYFEVIDESQKQLIYGFQVFRGNISNDSTLENYAAWVDMLSKGYRIYATSGRDTHADLSDRTLTSIYANTCDGTKCTGTCEDTNCTGYDKGNLLPQLASGDFTAGSVGIQMSIGSTLMGGSCDFTTNTRLVIGIGEIHSGMLVDGNTYRVEVLNENGVVYSQQIATDGTTKIALDTTSCGFYRVEVYNATTGERIAIGNPIWNDNYTWNNN